MNRRMTNFFMPQVASQQTGRMIIRDHRRLYHHIIRTTVIPEVSPIRCRSFRIPLTALINPSGKIIIKNMITNIIFYAMEWSCLFVAEICKSRIVTFQEKAYSNRFPDYIIYKITHDCNSCTTLLGSVHQSSFAKGGRFSQNYVKSR